MRVHCNCFLLDSECWDCIILRLFTLNELKLIEGKLLMWFPVVLFSIYSLLENLANAKRMA
jgi:hypothetical protein